MALGGVYSAEGILKIAFVIHRVVFLRNFWHAMFLGRSLTISSSQNVRKTSISSSTKNNLKETLSPRLPCAIGVMLRHIAHVTHIWST